jgi:nucleoside-diphosphate-sugar epimerase
MIRVLIVGSGDVARRVLPYLAGRCRVFALVRDAAKADWWRAQGARPILADLDRPRSLARLRGIAEWVLHFAPPPETGEHDPRMRKLLAALAGGRSLPRRLVYISTTGVYGDCGGARFDETRRLRPGTARARRRVDAERTLRRWSRNNAVRSSILRVPGIYADDRLPLARLRAGTPVLAPADDVYTSHIHADDLARSAWFALRRGRSNRVYHAVDDSQLKMADYFDCVADAFALPRPPRIRRAEAATAIGPAMLSFMSESRRLDNRRLKRELGVRLAHPQVAESVAAMAARRAENLQSGA